MIITLLILGFISLIFFKIGYDTLIQNMSRSPFRWWLKTPTNPNGYRDVWNNPESDSFFYYLKNNLFKKTRNKK